MNIELTTPALLFPAVSLLMLAYTNRFLALANLIRTLHQRYTSEPEPRLFVQIQHLRKRVGLIRKMQEIGVLSLLFCGVCMFLVFLGKQVAARYVFGFSLLTFLVSLAYSVREIHISVEALNLHLTDLEAEERQHPHGRRPS